MSMMKKLIYTIAFTLAGLAGMAQTNEPLPGDAEPLTNQLYLSPSDSTVWAADPFSGLAINLGSWWKVDSLFKEGYTKAQVDSVVIKFPTAFGYVAPFKENPIIVPEIGEWDEEIREIGNVWEDNGTYYFTYTGFIPPYDDGNVSIGLATSSDGFTWTKQGQITEQGFEDPFLVKHNGVWFLYTEKKQSSAPNHLGVNLHKGVDIMDLTDEGLVLDKGSSGQWDDRDVSSPTVHIEGDTFYLFYEGRGTPTTRGSVGLATSSDGESFTKQPNPVATGTDAGTDTTFRWSTHIVPDDVMALNGKYYLVIHGWTGTVNAAGWAESDDLLNWEDILGTYAKTGARNETNNGQGTPFLSIGSDIHMLYCYVTGNKGVYIGKFGARPGGDIGYTIRQDAISYPSIAPANRSEFIDLSASSSFNYKLSPDPNSGNGVYKFIRNTSAVNVTLTPETGVTIDGASSAITFRPGDYAVLVCSAPNEWIIVDKGVYDGSQFSTDLVFKVQQYYKDSQGNDRLFFGQSSSANNVILKGSNSGSSSFLVRNTSNSDVFAVNYQSGNTTAAGTMTVLQYRLSALNTPPASATDTGTTGEIRITSTHIYVCIATNTWVRAALTTW